MPVLYDRREMNAILKELKIQSIEGKIDGHEAARILTWRALHEQHVERVYTDHSVRRHISLKNLTPYPLVKAGKEQARHNLYKVEDIFLLPLAPKRGTKPKEPISKHP